ncbi:cation efflux protein [Auriculariales sp. MPI-PUGE-AT-0066]|nr:cation efflux protein [Auriculariales sp. MPI-PUGE-AT-0066]
MATPSSRQEPLLLSDPRTRRRVQMREEGKDRYSAPLLVASNALLVVSIAAAKTWLLNKQFGPAALALVELTAAATVALGSAVFHKQDVFVGDIASEIPAIMVAGVLQLIQHGALFFALDRLSLVRTMALAQFPALWISTVTSSHSTWRTLASLMAITLSFSVDIVLNAQTVPHAAFPHLAILAHILASTALQHTQAILVPKLGAGPTHRITLTASAVLCVLALLASQSLSIPLGFNADLPALSYASIPVLAFTAALFSPIAAPRTGQLRPTAQSFTTSFASVALFAYISSTLIRSLGFRWLDLGVVVCAAYGAYPATHVAPPKSTSTTQFVRTNVKAILANPESRKIFYFLVLNLAFMLVQMMYGVWTNSLGLISDAIHMAFDCMAIAMGLFASVMATWTPNEKFTYGYGRIETLSGFANGIFLLLISVFIVFEAVQRLIDPPEMNTNQLLLVSSMGLGVNLFGMFAMGGHHHHVRFGPLSALILTNVTSGSRAFARVWTSPRMYTIITTIRSMDTMLSTTTFMRYDSPQSRVALLKFRDRITRVRTMGRITAMRRCIVNMVLLATTPESIITTMTAVTASLRGIMYMTVTVNMYTCRLIRCPHPKTVMPTETRIIHPTLTIVTMFANSFLIFLHSILSPITPSYRFGEDSHFAEVHAHAAHPTPNTHSHSHSHDAHGHSHNMRGVFLHVMADTLGSVGVITSTLLIQWYGWTGFDPIASIFIAIMIAASVYPLVIDCARVLSLDIGPERGDSVRQALSELQSVEGVAGYSAPQFWPKDASTLIGAIHIRLTRSKNGHGPANMERVMERVDALLRRRIPGLDELTIQVMSGT